MIKIQGILAGTLAVIIIVVILLTNALFIVNQTEQAIVFQFGDPKVTIQEPGLHAKIPFIQNVRYFEKRILNLDPPVEQILLGDKKRINVNSYARYKIVDPLKFYISVETIATFNSRFGSILNSTVRQVMGKFSLAETLNNKRDYIMDQITKLTKVSGKNYGIEVVDVRLGRTDLPKDISKSVYLNMQSERIQEANLLRAEGEQAKQEIIANTDKQKVMILAQAEKEAQILQGEGDAERNIILAKAYGVNESFFKFYRSLTAYEDAFKGSKNQLILNSNLDFFQYLFKKR